MKTLLNLLPEEKKDMNQRKLRFRFFLWQLFLVLMLECFYLGIMAGIFFILDFQLKTYQDLGNQLSSASFQEKRLSEYEEKFREANELADIIGKISYAHLYFTGTLLMTNDLLPDGIVLERLTTKEYAVLLSGTATKRDDLLVLDARLKDNECIEKVNLPISNLFSQSDIEFQVDFSIKPACLRSNR